MKPARIANADVVLGAPVNWNIDDAGPVMGLPVRLIVHENGLTYLVSAWEPTPDELAALNRGETLKLWICQDTHPVVALSVGDIE